MTRHVMRDRAYADLPAAAKDIYRRSAKLSAQRGIRFSLTEKEFALVWRRADGRCEVSGLPFSSERASGTRRRPYAASLDRIDSGRGYVASNVRIVCLLVNVALNNWGLESLIRVACAIAADPERARRAQNAAGAVIPDGYETAVRYVRAHLGESAHAARVSIVANEVRKLIPAAADRIVVLETDVGRPRRDGTLPVRSVEAYPIADLASAFAILSADRGRA